MRQAHTLFALAGLLCAGVAQAEATPYYNPANQASETGLTAGSNLYRTIGCPGQGLLEQDCSEAAPSLPPAAPAAQAAPAPAVAAVQEPAPVAAAKPEPVSQPAVIVTAAPVVAAADTPANPYAECYDKMVKQTADGFRDFSAMFFKPMTTR